jgi:hypothetical protein
MKFSRVSLIVILYGHDTRSLKFENFSHPSNKLNAKECQGKKTQWLLEEMFESRFPRAGGREEG